MITVGCSGFPVARARYFKRFTAVEISSTFQKLPRRSTLERWRRDIPAETLISVCAWQPLTHPCTNTSFPILRPALSRARMLHYGPFLATPEVRKAWARFEEVLEVLCPRFILFRTPVTFHPSADHLRDMYRFFKGMRRRRALPVWMPSGSAWNDRLVRRVCKDLNLCHGVDPLREAGLGGGVHYYRLAGRDRYDRNHRYSDGELHDILARCDGKPAYVFFDTFGAWRDAQRFHALADPVAARLASVRPRGGRR